MSNELGLSIGIGILAVWLLFASVFICVLFGRSVVKERSYFNTVTRPINRIAQEWWDSKHIAERMQTQLDNLVGEVNVLKSEPPLPDIHIQINTGGDEGDEITPPTARAKQAYEELTEEELQYITERFTAPPKETSAVSKIGF